MKLYFSLNFIFAIVLEISLLNSIAATQVIPTDEWVSFYGRNSLFQGKPIPIGSIIDAYDPDGVHCGSFNVTKSGQYGFLFVYRDNALTENLDEGASPGDTITFKINGKLAKTLGPDLCLWTQKGDIWQVDLADNLPPSQTAPIHDLMLLEDAPDTILVDLDEIFFDPDNDSLHFSATSDLSAVLPLIDRENRLSISVQSNWSGSAAVFIIAQDLWFEVRDTFFVLVNEINDPPEIRHLPDTSFVCNDSLIIFLNDYVEDVDHPLPSLSWQAQVLPPYQDSLMVELDNTEKVATFTARYSFSACVAVIFTVMDDSLDWDADTMMVQVTFPSAADIFLTHPQNISLRQNFPNPFNEITTISYYLPAFANVKLWIYSPIGQRIAMLMDKHQAPGDYSIQWKAENLGSGVYFMVLYVNGVAWKRKILLLK